MAEKVVIIGSGPAGWTAALYAARANLEPLVFEGAINNENQQLGTLPLGQLALTTEVENYPGFPDGIMGPELMELFRQQAKRFGTRVTTDDVTSIDLGSHPFRGETIDTGSFEALSVIIATGARANYLGLPTEEAFKNRGVSACAVCDGALPRFRNKPLVVVGGGDSAAEEATFLTKFADKVHLIHRRDELRASKVMQQRVFDNEKIEIHWNRTVSEVLGNDELGVTAVKLASTVDDTTEELGCSGMFAAIGHTPNTHFLEGQLDMNEAGYLVWTEKGRTTTTIEGVFAAGDVADDYYRQAITAAGSGCQAALDAERWLASKGLAE